MTKEFTVEKIVWIDPCSQDEWIDTRDIDDSLDQIISVGIVAKETETFVVICLNMDLKNDNLSCLMYIPKVVILSRELLCKI